MGALLLILDFVGIYFLKLLYVLFGGDGCIAAHFGNLIFLKLLLIFFNEVKGGMGALLLILDFGFFEITAHII